jgi:hypothetical protein
MPPAASFRVSSRRLRFAAHVFIRREVVPPKYKVAVAPASGIDSASISMARPAPRHTPSSAISFWSGPNNTTSRMSGRPAPKSGRRISQPASAASGAAVAFSSTR